MESGPKDNISVARESSTWILIRNSLSSSYVILLRTAGRSWNDVKLYAEFAALWIASDSAY